MRRERVCTYEYPDARGRVLLCKQRYEPKAFAMRARRSEQAVWVPPRQFTDRSAKAHAYFHSLLFNLPLLLDGPDRVAWTEGEKDAEALTAAGLPSVSHWQGAGVGPAAEQFAWFRRFRGLVTVVADRDAAGALDALRRYEGLRAIGIPARRIAVVRAAGGKSVKDAADHLAAGYGIADLVPVDMDKLRAVAATAPPPSDSGQSRYGGSPS